MSDEEHAESAANYYEYLVITEIRSESEHFSPIP